jgi:hypothetical protein
MFGASTHRIEQVVVNSDYVGANGLSGEREENPPPEFGGHADPDPRI